MPVELVWLGSLFVVGLICFWCGYQARKEDVCQKQWERQWRDLLAKAFLPGRVSGLGSGTCTFRPMDESKDVIVATIDSKGRRMVLDLTSPPQDAGKTERSGE